MKKGQDGRWRREKAKLKAIIEKKNKTECTLENNSGENKITFLSFYSFHNEVLSVGKGHKAWKMR